MSIKRTGETALFDFYRWTRKVSAERKRIREFKHKVPEKVLTPEQESEVKAFYAPYRVPHLVFHNYFTKVSGVFYPEYIPQDLYVGYIDPHLNDIVAAKYYDNKCLYSALFHGIPQPELLLKRYNGIWIDGRDCPVSREEMKTLVEQAGTGLFVKEAQTSAGGRGVSYLEGDRVNLEDVLEIAERIKTDLVVQKEMRQHEAMAALNPSSVNTLRLHSVLWPDGTVKIYSTVIRMGVGDSKLDNYSSGGFSGGVREDGHMRRYAYSKKGEKVEVHPTSGVRFEGYEIPCYQEVKELVHKAHPMMAHFRSISWDIAIDQDGTPVLIEANLCRSGIDSLQLNNGPLFGEDTRKILDEVFGKGSV